LGLASAVAAAAALLVIPPSAGHSAETRFVKKSPLAIGFSIQSAQDPSWQGYVHGIQDEMKKYGFTKLLTQDS
jgi:ABC-type sugar transport system substrate-binding protein